MRRSLVLPPRTAAAGDEDQQQHGARPNSSLSPRRAPSVLPRSPELLRMLRAHYAPESAETAVAASPSTNEHYTDAALLRREALRFDPAVVQALQRLWQLARPLGGAIARFDEERYVRMWIALQRQLGGGKGSVAAAQLEARAEFAVDSQGESALGARAFGTAMFALADLWTTEISVDAHRSFLATSVEPVLRRLRRQDVAAMEARARAVGEAEVRAREAAAAAAAAALAAALAAGRAAARAAAAAAVVAAAAAARRRRAEAPTPTPTRSTPPPPRRQRRRRRPPPEPPPAQGRAEWWRARCGGWVPGRCPAGATPAARGSGECATDCTVDGDDPAIAPSCCMTVHATVALSLSIVPVPQQQPGGWARCSAAGQQGAEPPELAAPAAVAQAPLAGWVPEPGNAEPCYARAWERAAEVLPTAQGRGRQDSSCTGRTAAAQLRGTARLRAKLQHLGASRDDWRGSRTDHSSAW